MSWLEIGVHDAIQSIVLMIEGDMKSMGCRGDVHDTYDQRIDIALESCTWSAQGAGSCSINQYGRQNTNVPRLPGEYYHWVNEPSPEGYVLR